METSLESFTEKYSTMYEELGWEDLNGEGYYGIKKYSDFSKQDGRDYRLSVYSDGNIIIEEFPIYYGKSAADSADNYDCYITFNGRINDEKDLEKLMGWLEIPVKKNNYALKQE